MIESKLNGESKDILEENIQKLKELFPEILTEDKIDFNKLKTILTNEIDDSPERYNFTWAGKSKAIAEAQKPSTGTLRPCKEESKDWDTTKNLYIEGDNLEVLKLLQKTYYGKIKMIYIDPPYNTGNDIIYKNNYIDNIKNYLKVTGQVSTLEKEKESNEIKLSTNTESDGRFHTNWINMMYPRLKLARNFLSEDGCMVVTIDHYELNNLLDICDELYGEYNRLGIVSVINNPMGRQNAKFFSSNNEYMLVYAKNVGLAKFNSVVLSEEKAKEFKYSDDNGNYMWKPFLHDHKKGLRENKPNNWYPLFVSKDLKEISLDKKNDFIEVMPISKSGIERSWMTIKEATQEKINSKEIIAKNKNGKIIIYRKFRDQERIFTVWDDKKYNSNHHGSRLVQELLGNNIFDFPKSIHAVKDILKMIINTDSLVIDFFSGSGTTAHAIMDLNKEDNGNRNFIMVQFPFAIDEKSEAAYNAGYKTIADIGKERIRRAGEKINNKDLDIGFKVLKLDSSNLNKWNPDYNNLEQTLIDATDNLVPGRTELDLVYEVMLKYGIDLTLAIEEYIIDNKKVYSIGYGSLLICLDDNITKEIAIPLIELKNKLSPETIRIVFKDNGFASDSDKTNIKESLKTNNVDEFITI